MVNSKPPVVSASITPITGIVYVGDISEYHLREKYNAIGTIRGFDLGGPGVLASLDLCFSRSKENCALCVERNNCNVSLSAPGVERGK